MTLLEAEQECELGGSLSIGDVKRPYLYYNNTWYASAFGTIMNMETHTYDDRIELLLSNDWSIEPDRIIDKFITNITQGLIFNESKNT